MATREEIYTAIRNADKAGDSAAVRTLGNYLKTMPADTPAPTVTPKAPIQPEAPIEAPNAVTDVGGGILKGAGDVTASLGSSIVASPVAGLAGIAQGVKNFVSNDGTNMSAADRVKQVQGALTYEPRSDVGKEAVANIQAPVQWAADKADAAGQFAADKTGSPLVGTAVTTALQGAPALLAPEVRGAVGSVARGVTGAAKAAAATGVDAATAAAATAKAKIYASNNGLDWDSLSAPVQNQLSAIAQTAKGLDNLDPAAVARQNKFQSLPKPVPATRGVLDRDRGALLNENNAAATPAGADIATAHAATNQALLDNLDILKKKVSGTGDTAATATSSQQTGAAVQGAARAKLEFQKTKVKAAYEAADTSGETAAKVDITPIDDMIRKTPDQSHYGYAKSWIDQNTDGAGSGMSIRDLEDLRKSAVAKASNGGEDAHYAGQLISAIDKATEGAGGKLYAQARALRRQQGLEFEDQGAVADLVDNSSRTDRATALENTVKTIRSGSLEDIENVKRTLLTGGDETTRTAGRQAMREIRAQVVQDIKDKATNGVATLKDGTPNLTPGAMKTAIDAYGPQKLDSIFGPGTAKTIYKILDVAADSKTIPSTGGAAVGSTTTQQILNFLGKGTSKLLDKVPVIGKLGGAAAQGAMDIAAERAALKTSATTPLGDALKKAKSQAQSAKSRAQLQQAVPLSSLYQQSSR